MWAPYVYCVMLVAGGGVNILVKALHTGTKSNVFDHVLPFFVATHELIPADGLII